MASGCNNKNYYCNDQQSIAQATWCSIFPLFGSVHGFWTLHQTINQREIKILLAIDCGGTCFSFLLAYLEIVYLYWKNGSFRTFQTVIFTISCASCALFMTSICAVGYIKFMHKRYLSGSSAENEISSSIRVNSSENS